MKIVHTMSVDLAKNFIQVLALDENHREVFNRRIVVSTLLDLVRKNAPKRVVIEACSTAHYWARQFGQLGIEVILIPPQFVTPFRVGDKNDSNDCWAIFEASLRPRINAVPVKTEQQQMLQTWIRRRESLVADRTGRVNAIRAYLAEFGIYTPKGIGKFFDQARKLAEKNDWQVHSGMKEMFENEMAWLSHIDEQIEYFDKLITGFAKKDAACIELQKLGGIGPITAVAVVATLIKPSHFKNGRQFSAYLGLVPRQNSTGGVAKLYGVGKDGNRYLRQLLIHGGRSVLRVASNNEDAMSRWAVKKKEQRGFNRACVAIANKNARMIWAVMAKAAA